MTYHNITYGPKTVAKADSGGNFTYVTEYDRQTTRRGLLHRLVTNVDIRVERGSTDPVRADLSGPWYASDGPMEFMPTDEYPNLGFVRYDGRSFDFNSRVYIELIDRDRRADVPLKVLLDTQAGSFSRSSVTTNQTSATTVESLAANVRAFMDRGDVASPQITICGSFVNLVTQSNDYTSNWLSISSGGQGYANEAVSPDGLQNAGRWDLPLAASLKYGPTLNPSLTAGQRYSIQAWAKAATFTSVGLPFRLYAGTPGLSATIAPTDKWALYSGNGTVTTSSVIGPTGVAGVPNVGDPAFNQYSAYVYGAQLVNLPHEVPLINTSGTTLTRAADVLTYSSAEYDPELLTLGGTFTIWPFFSSLEMPNFVNRYILSLAGGSPSERFMFETGSGIVYLRVIAGNIERIRTNNLAFARHSPITFTIRPNLGTLNIVGATGGGGTYTGTPWSWPTGTIRYGGAVSSTFELFGRVSNIYNVQG